MLFNRGRRTSPRPHSVMQRHGGPRRRRTVRDTNTNDVHERTTSARRDTAGSEIALMYHVKCVRRHDVDLLGSFRLTRDRYVLHNQHYTDNKHFT
ncbi:hypothetical protein EVAR_87653_1 [Eumeta japonica]|uniref:Uncharacterized protein n=1 Tax=Eumeta variegata TaxID=151549 RepID=A0A4C1WI09_EUMVA|nr:hypothetical protein EVAR_87653_1 [Eumeta japonica]